MSLKKVFLILILLIPLKISALELEFPDIVSKYAIVYDLTNEEILYEKDSTTKTSIASLTKILTAITAIEEIDDLNAPITITSDMLEGLYWNASVAGLKVGDTLTYADLIYATILPSGADAALVLAKSLKGSEEAFALDMNLLAQKIGLENSHFLNTSGLDATGQYSCAKDVQKILTYALANPFFRQVYTTKQYTLNNGLTINSTLKGYETKLNQDFSRIIGSKTGTTAAAGLCLASLVNVKDHEILIITIKAPYDNNYYNLQDNLTILTFLEQNYITAKPPLDDNFLPNLTIEEENVNQPSSTPDLTNQPKTFSNQNPWVILISSFSLVLIIILIFKNLHTKF